MSEKDGGSTANCTMRDYFAAAALLGIISKKPFAQFPEGSAASFEAKLQAARGAYRYADAMLRARTQGEPNG